jgi:ribokinase
MPNAPRIAVIGSANTDLTTFTDVFPRPGETLFGKAFEMGFGGKGANQAVAARLCGAEVVMVAKVGKDLFGQATIDNFASFGIDTRHVQIVADAPTGVAPIFVEPNGQNRIIVVKGANDRLTPADVDAAAADLAHVDAIILQFEIPLETVYHAIRFARAHRHPLHRQSGAGGSRRPGHNSPPRIFSFRMRPKPSKSPDCRCIRRADAVACAARPARKRFSTSGDYLGRAWFPAGRYRGAPEHVPPFSVTSVDSSGAGDAFIGSLAAFLAEGLPEPQALARANLYAALSTTKVGTQKSFPKRTDFEAEWDRRRATG